MTLPLAIPTAKLEQTLSFAILESAGGFLVPGKHIMVTNLACEEIRQRFAGSEFTIVQLDKYSVSECLQLTALHYVSLKERQKPYSYGSYYVRVLDRVSSSNLAFVMYAREDVCIERWAGYNYRVLTSKEMEEFPAASKPKSWFGKMFN